MIAGLIKENKAVEAGKTNDQLRELSVEEYVVKSINGLQKLHDRLCSPQSNDCVNDIKKFVQSGGGLGIFSHINNAEKTSLPLRTLAVWSQSMMV